MSETPPTPPSAADLGAAVQALKARARALATLAEAGTDVAALRRARSSLDRTPAVDDGPLVARLDAWLAHEAAHRRPTLARQLRQAADAGGPELVVLTRDPLELRLPPLGVLVDVDADRADLTFGRELLARTGARADEILAARDAALAALHEHPWDAADFHRALRTAWQRRGADWVELVDLLPDLVLALQSDRWRRDPSARLFRPYSRAQLCYDLWRLRRDRALTVDGWRLSLGSATGDSTRDKKRVFWLEDDRGRGQYFLTLRFVADAEPA